jgi:hypothetical protein
VWSGLYDQDLKRTVFMFCEAPSQFHHSCV